MKTFIIRSLKTGAAITVLGLALASSVFATTTFITSRAALAGTDFLDWGSLGPYRTYIASPFNILSNGGGSVTVSKALEGALYRIDQTLTDNFGGWGGNFTPGDRLLFAGNHIYLSTYSNPISFTNFSGKGIMAGGTQIQPMDAGPFTAKIEAFDALNNSLGSYTQNGLSTDYGEAMFMGISSTVPIYTLKISLTSVVSTGQIASYAINQFDFTPTQAVLVDIRPNSCPNLLNIKKQGVLRVAIVGTADLNVEDIDVSSVTINAISPFKSSIQDVTTPFTGELSNCQACNTQGSDGQADLVLHFNATQISNSLGSVTDKQCVVLTINGKLNNGLLFEGKDVVTTTSK